MRPRVASSLRADWRGHLNSAWTIAFATSAFIALTIYAFKDMVSLDPYLRASGFSALLPGTWVPPISIIVALAPLLWLRRTMTQLSDFCVLYLYLFVFVPSCALLPYSSILSEYRQIEILLTLLVAFSAVELRRFLPILTVPRILGLSEKHLILALSVFANLIVGSLIVFGRVSFENISFLDVYENREAYLSDSSSIRVILGYIANWGAFAVAPVMLVLGIHRRLPLFAALGLAVAFVAFAATSFKSHLFVPLVVVGMYYLLRISGGRRIGLPLACLAVSLTLVPIMWDLALNGGPAATWLVHFRFVGNNGFLTAQYFNVFETMPKGFFADSIGRFWFEPAFNVPIAQVVGESFSPVRGNHANASLWADGYGNLGTFGVMFATFELIVFLWILDAVSRGRDMQVTAPVMLSVGFVLGNTAVHTMLTSNGGLLLLLLFAALPYAARAGSSHQVTSPGFSRP